MPKYHAISFPSLGYYEYGLFKESTAQLKGEIFYSPSRQAYVFQGSGEHAYADTLPQLIEHIEMGVLMNDFGTTSLTTSPPSIPCTSINTALATAFPKERVEYYYCGEVGIGPIYRYASPSITVAVRFIGTQTVEIIAITQHVPGAEALFSTALSNELTQYLNLAAK